KLIPFRLVPKPLTFITGNQLCQYLCLPRLLQGCAHFIAGQHAILVVIDNLVQPGERDDGTAISPADLGAVVVPLICIQQAFGVEGVSQLFQGSTGVFDPLEIQPLPGAMPGSDQILLCKPAVDGVVVLVGEQSTQPPPVGCVGSAALTRSFHLDLARGRQAIQQSLRNDQVDTDLAAAVA